MSNNSDERDAILTNQQHILATALIRYSSLVNNNKPKSKETLALQRILHISQTIALNSYLEVAALKKRLAALENKLAANDVLSRLDVKSIEKEAMANINKQKFI